MVPDAFFGKRALSTTIEEIVTANGQVIMRTVTSTKPLMNTKTGTRLFTTVLTKFGTLIAQWPDFTWAVGLCNRNLLVDHVVLEPHQRLIQGLLSNLKIEIAFKLLRQQKVIVRSSI